MGAPKDIRVWFAGQALIALNINGEELWDRKSVESVASVAYRLADAMMVEREKPVDEEVFKAL